MADDFGQQFSGGMTPPPPPPPPPPSAGGMPPAMGGMPADQGDPAAAGAAQPQKPSPPANFQLGAKLPKDLKVKVPPHALQFDEQYFLRLLAGSISLTRDEKKRIVESIPKLKQSQIDELIRIFEDEKRKFAELGDEHVAQLEKLAQKHYEEWMDIELGQEQGAKQAEDAAQADALRKQLGLGGGAN